MLWGANQISSFTKLVVKGYADIVMGFNELVLFASIGIPANIPWQA